MKTLLLACLLLQGCAEMVATGYRCDGDSYPYMAFRNECEWYSDMGLSWLVFDMPVTIAFDTACLPVDAYQSGWRWR